MPATQTPPDDPAEPDLAWSGYSGLAALPGALVGGLAGLVVILLGPAATQPLGVEQHLGRLPFYAVAGILAGWPLLSGAFRSASYVYRLTATRLYVDYGFFSNPTPPVRLADVTGTTPEAGPVARLLGYGTVTVRTPDRVVRLVGVRHPHSFVALANRLRETAP